MCSREQQMFTVEVSINTGNHQGDVCFFTWKMNIRTKIFHSSHYNDFTISAMASQITSLAIVYSTVYLGADQRKHQSSAPLVTGEFPAQKASNAGFFFHLMTSSGCHYRKWCQPIGSSLSVVIQLDMRHMKSRISSGITTTTMQQKLSGWIITKKSMVV